MLAVTGTMLRTIVLVANVLKAALGEKQMSRTYAICKRRISMSVDAVNNIALQNKLSPEKINSLVELTLSKTDMSKLETRTRFSSFETLYPRDKT